MEFSILTEKEYRDFFENCTQASFMQSIELSHLKEDYQDKVHLIGIKKNNKIVAGTMLLESSSTLNKKMFYAPRGLMVDYNDYELLSFFTIKLKEYIKRLGGFILTIDPNVIYRVRSSNGDIIPNNKSNDVAISNLKKLGYNHYGFNVYLDAKQARWAYRMPLDEDYETKKSKFSKSTRKNIESCMEL